MPRVLETEKGNRNSHRHDNAYKKYKNAYWAYNKADTEHIKGADPWSWTTSISTPIWLIKKAISKYMGWKPEFNFMGGKRKYGSPHAFLIKRRNTNFKGWNPGVKRKSEMLHEAKIGRKIIPKKFALLDHLYEHGNGGLHSNNIQDYSEAKIESEPGGRSKGGFKQTPHHLSYYIGGKIIFLMSDKWQELNDRVKAMEDLVRELSLISEDEEGSYYESEDDFQSDEEEVQIPVSIENSGN